jgi:hypothetical protein
MSARVSRESLVHPMVPEAEVPKPAAAPNTSRPTRDQAEQFRATENDARAGTFGRTLERWFGGVLATVPEGGKKELELSIEGGKKLAGSGKLKLAVEQKDGQYLVTVHGAMGLGVGEQSKGVKATATAGFSGAATFKFGSREEAADALSALVQTFPETGVLNAGTRAVAALIRDDDALGRALRATGRLQSIDFKDQLGGKLSATEALGKDKVDIGLGATLNLADAKLDLARGVLVLGWSAEVGADARLPRQLGPSGLKGSANLANLKLTVALEQHFPVSLQDIERIQQGEVMQVVIDRARHSRTEAVVRGEGSVAGLDVKAERRGPPGQVLQEVAEGSALLASNWSFQGFKVSGEASTELDAGILKVKGTVKERQTVIMSKGEFAPFLQQALDAQKQERWIQAQQAMGH